MNSWSAFDLVACLLNLKLVLNAVKTKVMVVSGACGLPENITSVAMAQGKPIEVAHSYKYMYFLIDRELSFKAHIANSVHKLVFYFRARKLLISETFLLLRDCGDVLYMNASTKCFQSLNTVYQCALRFVSGCACLTHHCDLYSKAGWSSLSVRRNTHWMPLIYKALLGLVPAYLNSFLQRTKSRYALRSCDIVHQFGHWVQTDLGKRAFSFAAPSAWNTLKTNLNVLVFVLLEEFLSILCDRRQEPIGQCMCF